MNVHPELDAGRRTIRATLSARRLAKKRITYDALGERTGDQGSTQLQSFLHGRRSLPLGLAVRVAVQLRVALMPLLTTEQRKTVRLVFAAKLLNLAK